MALDPVLISDRIEAVLVANMSQPDGAVARRDLSDEIADEIVLAVGQAVGDGDKGDIAVTGTGTVWSIETALKTAWNSAVTWIATNGSALISHLSNTSNPHSTTAAQVGAEPTIAAGTVSQFWRGDKTWQDLAAIATIYPPGTESPVGEWFTHLLRSPDNNYADMWSAQVGAGGTITYFAAAGTGVQQINPSTTVGGYGGFLTTTYNLIPRGVNRRFKTRVSVTTVTADGVNQTMLLAGFLDRLSTVQLAGHMFQLTINAGSVTWRAWSKDFVDGTVEFTNLTLPAINTWFTLEVAILPNDSFFYVNDILVASHTKRANKDLGSGTLFVRAANGTLARTVDVDYNAQKIG